MPIINNMCHSKGGTLFTIKYFNFLKRDKLSAKESADVVVEARIVVEQGAIGGVHIAHAGTPIL